MMSTADRPVPRDRRFLWLAALAILASAASAVAGNAAVRDPVPGCVWDGPRPEFPKIQICAFPGAFQDSTHLIDPVTREPYECSARTAVPRGALPNDSLRIQPRTITVRFRRDPRAEARRDFGGYRIYRVTNYPDSTRMVLIRRFSRQKDDSPPDRPGGMWHFSLVDTATLEFRCKPQFGPTRIAIDSIVTFVDPDSSGNWVKVCRRPGVPERCDSRGDSIFKLIPPPGPHDGFLTWYSVVYEERSDPEERTYEELFVPDTSVAGTPAERYAKCETIGDPFSCPNLNHKLANLTPAPVEPTAGPTPNLEQVGVVPNPYRAREVWDRETSELHFINLPNGPSTIRIYTVSGDLVVKLAHDDKVRDFERWDLKNDNGRDVASGIYMYRVEAEKFSFQGRFIVIR